MNYPFQADHGRTRARRNCDYHPRMDYRGEAKFEPSSAGGFGEPWTYATDDRAIIYALRAIEADQRQQASGGGDAADPIAALSLMARGFETMPEERHTVITPALRAALKDFRSGKLPTAPNPRPPAVAGKVLASAELVEAKILVDAAEVIAKVEAIEPDGTTHDWWEGVDPYKAPAIREIAWFGVRVLKTAYLVAHVKLTLNLASGPGYKQIDAVQLVAAP